MGAPGVRKWFDAKDGRRYPVTAQHYFNGDIIICPVCGQRPCHWDCAEQMLQGPEPRPSFLDVPVVTCYCQIRAGGEHRTDLCLLEGVVGASNYREVDDPRWRHTPEGVIDDEAEEEEPALRREPVMGGVR